MTIASLVIVLSAAVLCAALILALRPLLDRYALARPNARSSHKTPTAQGGGIAVIAACLIVAVVAMIVAGVPMTASFYGAAASTLLMAMVGIADDLHPLPVLPRLLLQALAAAIVIATLPDQFRIVSALPGWLEKALIALALMWFVNLVNFMDGLDWMTVAEIVPVSLALALFGWQGVLTPAASTAAFALAGAMIGFAPFNKPVARLFLGDVGSLPIGLLTGWMLLTLAQEHAAAALLLPLYYLADATLTLFRRIANREAVWVAHRSHFYQRATDNGYSVPHIVAWVFGLNIALAALAFASVALHNVLADAALLGVGCAATAFVLFGFSRVQQR